MPIRLVENKQGNYNVKGLTRSYAEYEKDLFAGKIPCPFKIKITDCSGKVFAAQPIPLTTEGKPKIPIPKVTNRR